MRRSEYKFYPKRRILDNSKPDPITGCWIWLGFVAPNGYGQLSVGNKTVLAHRYSYEVFIGPVPKELQINHRCAVKKCVNPNHLETVTPKENILDSIKRGTHKMFGRKF